MYLLEKMNIYITYPHIKSRCRQKNGVAETINGRFLLSLHRLNNENNGAT